MYNRHSYQSEKAELLSKLAALGIKHVRDGFHPTPPFPSWFSCQSNLVFNKGFADHGIKALLFMGYKWTGAQKWPLAGDFPNGTVDQHLAGIKRGMQDGQSCDASLTNPVPGVRPEAIEGFEWPNE